MNEDAYIWIDPRRRVGEPCIGGSRLPVAAVAVRSWYDGIDAAVDTYDITRQQALVACWYAGTYGITHIWRASGDRSRYVSAWREPWRARWRQWAESVATDLWHGRDVPDPPGRPT